MWATPAGRKSTPPTAHWATTPQSFRSNSTPGRLGVSDVLDVALSEHDLRRQTAKRQYQNILFTENERQREAIEAAIESGPFDREAVETRIEPLGRFYPAEDYHQKYNLRSHTALLGQFEEAGYDDIDIRESPAAAKLNAHVTGKDVSVPFLNARSR